MRRFPKCRRKKKEKVGTRTNLTIRNAHEMKYQPSSVSSVYLAGVQKASKVNREDLWSAEYGISIFKATMSLHCFHHLLNSMRFDEKSTKGGRVESDNMAAFRQIWTLFIKNCADNYGPSHQLTVDEQLMAFRGNCRFRVYMKSTPGKYGIKIFMLNDITYFFSNFVTFFDPIHS